jgi:hypothetical protein
MRYIAYGLAILAATFTVAFATGYLPRDATASHSEQTNGTMNVLELEQTSGAKALPRQDLPDEVYR